MGLIEQPDEDPLVILMSDVPTVTRDADLREVAQLVVGESVRRVLDSRERGCGPRKEKNG